MYLKLIRPRCKGKKNNTSSHLSWRIRQSGDHEEVLVSPVFEPIVVLLLLGKLEVVLGTESTKLLLQDRQTRPLRDNGLMIGLQLEV